MYAETKLNDHWYPCRIFEHQDELYFRSTIIWSQDAHRDNLISTDLIVPKERINLEANEPHYIQKMEAYGHRKFGRMSKAAHRRRVSALPAFNMQLPIDPYKYFKGINEDQVDVLEHSFGKLVQRAGKINVTWQNIYGKPGEKAVAYMQPVDDGTVRYQIICNLDVPFKKLRQYVLKDNYMDKIFERQAGWQTLPTEHINEQMKIVHCITPGSFFVGKREMVFYDFDIEYGTVAYRVQTSLEKDDKTFSQKIMDPNTTKMFLQPGSGFVLRRKSKDASQLVWCVHVDLGGYVTKYGFDSQISKYLVPKILPKIFNMEKHHKYQRLN